MEDQKSIQKDTQYPNLKLAVNWLINSGIQAENGAFYAWYDCEKNEYSFLYPEITGYSISLLLQLYRLMNDEIFLRRAILAGEWLLEIQRKDGSFYCKFFDTTMEYKKYDSSRYTFDAAICVSGLVDLFNATFDVKFLRAAEKTGNWLVRHQNQDGSFLAGISPDGENIEEYHWSRMSSCHHLKIVISLLKMHKILQRKKFFISAKKLLRWAQKFQTVTGEFLISSKSEQVYTHANNYAIEGLLKASEFFNDTSLLKNAVHGAKRLSKMQNDDGSVWNYYNSERNKIKVSDATAQALRIWLILNEKGVPFFSTNVDKGFEFLGKLQCLSENVHASGGIYYGQQMSNKIMHVNSWATIFTIQALMFKQKKENPSSISLLF